MNEIPDDSKEIPGERGIPSVNRASSIRSRVGTIGVVGLFGLLALCFIYFYYSNLWAGHKAAATAPAKPAADTRMPPFAKPPPTLAQVKYAQPDPTPPPALEPPPLRGVAWATTSTAPPAPPSGPPPKTPAELDMERRLRGSSVYHSTGPAPSVAVATQARDPFPGLDAPAAKSSDMSGLLKPTTTATARPMRLPSLDSLLIKGEFLDCALITAIDSTLPGMTACVLSADTWSASGSRVLLPRGTKLVGETRGEISQGQKRVFILWSEARTPNGSLIALASPGTDALGRSGVEGDVDRHWLERFGAALLLSVIDSAITAAASHGSGNVNVGIGGGTGVKDIGTEILKSTINIPPTIRINQGARVQVFVARDVDFSAQ